MMPRRAAFEIGGDVIRSGARGTVELPIARLATGSPVALPVIVIHGRHEGPTVWIDAAVHGDEINGVEIIRRVLEQLDPKELRGTVLAVPVVNLLGFMTGSRYLPDRRDLNRSFPGSRRGSLAGRIADLFLSEIVSRCTVGIDLHTGSDHRTNLPQIRANLDDPETLRLARAFAAPVMVHSATRDGSLRQAGTDVGATVLLYEGGEAWRFGETPIRAGVSGVLRVLAAIDMIDDRDAPDAQVPMVCRGSTWSRARKSGIASLWTELGDQVTKGQPIGRIHDSFGRRLAQITARSDGLVVGLNLDPIVNQGDAVVHIAHVVESDDDGAASIPTHQTNEVRP
jgi:predicted deacylase